MRTSFPSAVLLAAALPAAAALAQVPGTTWTVPGTVNAGGLNGTRFVSDVAITNPGNAPVQATISFLPAGATTPKPVTLGAGQTIAYRNVLDTLWGAQGAGATQVASDAPLLVRARTYNTAASGTYGVALPVFASERLLTPGGLADSLWVSQSADGSAGYRTNVAVVFPEESGGEARVTIFDADGNEIGSQDFALDGAGFQQFAVGSFAGSVAVARASVQVLRGTAAAYSVVVDNVTGDSSLFTFETLPAGWQDVLVNGVARANGRNGTFFRTDGRFYNPSSEDATVTVAFHDNRNANASPLTRDFVVPAGKIRDVVDVLDSLLGLPVGSAGALRFQSETPVAILCRTSNVDPLGVKPGTFGAQQKPRQILAFLMSADAGAVVTAIRQNAAFRTNVGFAAGPDGADYALTLKNASGGVVATAAGSLGAFGWTQPSVADLFPGSIPDDATLLVRVTSGSVDVFDSSIDNASGDPVVTPIMPLPADVPSAATIGPLGGTIRSSDGALTLRVPAGALGVQTPMSIALVANDAPGALGPGYDVSPDALAFAKPALLSLRYGTGALPVDRIGGVAVALQTGADWAGLGGGRIDDSGRALLVRLRSTSPSALGTAAAARKSAVGSGASRFGAVAALDVQSPNTRDGVVWVPTGGKAKFVAIFRVQPTSAGQTELVVPLNKGGGGVNVKWDRPTFGSFGSLAGGEVTYTAPARTSRVVEAVRSFVNATVIPTGAKYRTQIFFIVIRRNFLFDAYYNMNIPCGTSDVSVFLQPPVVTYNYFHFDDDLSFHAGPNVFIGEPETPVVKSCGGKGCHDALVTGKSGNLELNDLTADFHGFDGFFILGENFQKNAVPPYTQQGDALLCTGNDGTDLLIPVILGPNDSVYWKLYTSTQKSQSDGGAITLFWEWRSVDGDIP